MDYSNDKCWNVSNSEEHECMTLQKIGEILRQKWECKLKVYLFYICN